MLPRKGLFKTFILGGDSSSSDHVPEVLPSMPVRESILLSAEDHPDRALIDALSAPLNLLEEKYTSRNPAPAFTIPADDVVISRPQPEPKYVGAPKAHDLSQAPLFVRRRLEMLTAAPVEAKLSSAEHVGFPAQATSRSSTSISLSTISPNDLPSTSLPNPTKNGLSDQIINKFDESQEAARRVQFRQQLLQRTPLFDHAECLPDTSLSDPRIHHSTLPPLPSVSLLAEATQLHFHNFQMVEPVFLSLAFYDPIQSRKLTETWFFDFNNKFPQFAPLLAQMGRPHVDHPDSRRACFTLQDPSPDICLVVTLAKVLSAQDLDQVVEPYLKGVANLDKYTEKTLPRLKRLGYFLRPFAFGFTPLYEGNSNLLNGPVTVEFFRSRSAMSEDGLLDLINKNSIHDAGPSTSSAVGTPSAAASAANKKRLPIDLALTVKPLRPAELRGLPGRHSASLLQPLLPAAPSAQEAVREIAFLAEPAQHRRPSREVCHNLYFRPLSLNFSRHPNSSSRNIALRVSLCRTDLDLAAAASTGDHLYGRSSAPDFVSRQVIAVHYHESRPNWVNEEIKIALPFDLTPSDHLLIQYSHVSCTDPTEKKGLLGRKAAAPSSLPPLNIRTCPLETSVEQELGYSWVPLFDAHSGIIKSGLHTTPVSLNLMPGYLNPALAPGGAGSDVLKYIDSGKPLFAFAINNASSVYSEDEKVHAFLATFSAAASEEVITRPLLGLAEAAPSALAAFLPLILQFLNELVAAASPAIGAMALQTISAIVHKLNNFCPETATSFDRNQMVEHYLATSLDAANLHEPFMTAILATVELGTISCALWYAFDVISRSMLFSLHAAGGGGGASGPGSSSSAAPQLPTRELTAVKLSHRAAKFSFLSTFLPTLMNRILSAQRNSKLPPSILSSLNANFSLFLKDLLRVADRGLVATTWFTYITSIDPDSSFLDRVQIKADALRILCNYEHWIPLNLPYSIAAQPSITSDSLPTFSQTHCIEHPFIGLLLLETNIALRSSNPSVRQAILKLLFSLLWKHAKDTRYAASSDSQEIICNMYFPFLDVMIASHKSILDSPLKERQQWLLIFMHILRHCHRNNLLRPYWFSQTQKTVVGLLLLFEASISAFDDPLLIRESSYIILDAITSLVFDYKTDRRLIAADSHYMRPAFDTFLAIMSKPQSVFILASTFRTLRWFIITFANTIFIQPDPYYCGQLCYLCLKYANMPNGILQSEAAGVWWILLETNFRTKQNFARVKLQSTIAISRLASGETADYSQLLASLGHIKIQANAVLARQSAEITDLSEKLHNVIRDSIRIAESKFDPELTCELYYQVSLGYTHSPDLRISRLENLTDFHSRRQYWEEAAQCRLLMASLVLEYLLMTRPKSARSSVTHLDISSQELAPYMGLPTDKHALQRLSPALLSEPSLPVVQVSEADEEGLYTNQLFTHTGFWNLLKSAASFFKWGGYFELGLDVFDIFINKHQAERDYYALARSFLEMQAFASSIHSTERLFSRFYRIGFLGAGWGPYLDGKDFIYKEKNDVVFVQILKDRLLAQFSKKYPVDSIKLLPNTLQLNTPAQRTEAMKTMDPKALYLQIVAVTPYLTTAQLADRLTEWERSFNLQQFSFSVPFTVDGSKPSEDFSKQCIRKTILHTERPFPFVKNRIEIVRRETIELSPIETATEMIQEKIFAIQSATLEANKAADGTGLRSEKEACNVLQQLLQGAVLTMVNAGPFALATLFLSDPSKFPRPHVIALRNTFIVFMQSIERAITANRRVVSGELIPFQQECEKSFANLQERFQEILKNTHSFVE